MTSLGARIKVDPFTDRAELVKNKAVPLFSASEKMSFEVAPVFPYLTRYNTPPAALAASAK